jgi:hypothetical protein
MTENQPSPTVTFADARQRLALTSAGMIRAISSGDLRVERQADDTWFSEEIIAEYQATMKARRSAVETISQLLGQGD